MRALALHSATMLQCALAALSPIALAAQSRADTTRVEMGGLKATITTSDDDKVRYRRLPSFQLTKELIQFLHHRAVTPSGRTNCDPKLYSQLRRQAFQKGDEDDFMGHVLPENQNLTHQNLPAGPAWARPCRETMNGN